MLNLNVRIEVTQEDIDAGVKGSCSQCPIGRAFERALGPGFGIQYGSQGVNLLHSDSVYKQATLATALPRECRNFVMDFDAGLMVRPFNFSVAIPKRFLATGATA